MLIVSNGAFKSGSTWLFNILQELTQFPAPAAEYLHPEWINPSLHPDRLKHFLDRADYQEQNYLVKNHLAEAAERDLLLAYAQVYVLDIQRDLRDVVVSAYYHDCKKNGYSGDFSKYFWEWGWLHAYQVRKHHLTWQVASPKVYMASYENLLSNFQEEVQKIADFLGLKTSDSEIQRIETSTTLSKLREKYGEDPERSQILFFRKGVTGDWQNYFTADMLREIAEIEQQGVSLQKRVFRKFKRLSGSLIR